MKQIFKKTNRFLAAFLAVAMVLTMLPVTQATAWAETTALQDENTNDVNAAETVVQSQNESLDNSSSSSDESQGESALTDPEPGTASGGIDPLYANGDVDIQFTNNYNTRVKVYGTYEGNTATEIATTKKVTADNLNTPDADSEFPYSFMLGNQDTTATQFADSPITVEYYDFRGVVKTDFTEQNKNGAEDDVLKIGAALVTAEKNVVKTTVTVDGGGYRISEIADGPFKGYELVELSADLMGEVLAAGKVKTAADSSETEGLPNKAGNGTLINVLSVTVDNTVAKKTMVDLVGDGYELEPQNDAFKTVEYGSDWAKALTGIIKGTSTNPAISEILVARIPGDDGVAESTAVEVLPYGTGSGEITAAETGKAMYNASNGTLTIHANDVNSAITHKSTLTVTIKKAAEVTTEAHTVAWDKTNEALVKVTRLTSDGNGSIKLDEDGVTWIADDASDIVFNVNAETATGARQGSGSAIRRVKSVKYTEGSSDELKSATAGNGSNGATAVNANTKNGQYIISNVKGDITIRVETEEEVVVNGSGYDDVIVDEGYTATATFVDSGSTETFTIRPKQGKKLSSVKWALGSVSAEDATNVTIDNGGVATFEASNINDTLCIYVVAGTENKKSIQAAGNYSSKVVLKPAFGTTLGGDFADGEADDDIANANQAFYFSVAPKAGYSVTKVEYKIGADGAYADALAANSVRMMPLGNGGGVYHTAAPVTDALTIRLTFANTIEVTGPENRNVEITVAGTKLDNTSASSKIYVSRDSDIPVSVAIPSGKTNVSLGANGIKYSTNSASGTDKIDNKSLTTSTGSWTIYNADVDNQETLVFTAATVETIEAEDKAVKWEVLNKGSDTTNDTLVGETTYSVFSADEDTSVEGKPKRLNEALNLTVTEKAEPSALFYKSELAPLDSDTTVSKGNMRLDDKTAAGEAIIQTPGDQSGKFGSNSSTYDNGNIVALKKGSNYIVATASVDNKDADNNTATGNVLKYVSKLPITVENHYKDVKVVAQTGGSADPTNATAMTTIYSDGSDIAHLYLLGQNTRTGVWEEATAADMGGIAWKTDPNDVTKASDSQIVILSNKDTSASTASTATITIKNGKTPSPNPVGVQGTVTWAATTGLDKQVLTLENGLTVIEAATYYVVPEMEINNSMSYDGTTAIGSATKTLAVEGTINSATVRLHVYKKLSGSPSVSTVAGAEALLAEESPTIAEVTDSADIRFALTNGTYATGEQGTGTKKNEYKVTAAKYLNGGTSDLTATVTINDKAVGTLSAVQFTIAQRLAYDSVTLNLADSSDVDEGSKAMARTLTDPAITDYAGGTRISKVLDTNGRNKGYLYPEVLHGSKFVLPKQADIGVAETTISKTRTLVGYKVTAKGGEQSFWYANASGVLTQIGAGSAIYLAPEETIYVTGTVTVDAVWHNTFVIVGDGIFNQNTKVQTSTDPDPKVYNYTALAGTIAADANIPLVLQLYKAKVFNAGGEASDTVTDTTAAHRDVEWVESSDSKLSVSQKTNSGEAVAVTGNTLTNPGVKGDTIALTAKYTDTNGAVYTGTEKSGISIASSTTIVASWLTLTSKTIYSGQKVTTAASAYAAAPATDTLVIAKVTKNGTAVDPTSAANNAAYNWTWSIEGDAEIDAVLKNSSKEINAVTLKANKMSVDGTATLTLTVSDSEGHTAEAITMPITVKKADATFVVSNYNSEGTAVVPTTESIKVPASGTKLFNVAVAGRAGTFDAALTSTGTATTGITATKANGKLGDGSMDVTVTGGNKIADDTLAVTFTDTETHVVYEELVDLSTYGTVRFESTANDVVRVNGTEQYVDPTAETKVPKNVEIEVYASNATTVTANGNSYVIDLNDYDAINTAATSSQVFDVWAEPAGNVTAGYAAYGSGNTSVVDGKLYFKLAASTPLDVSTKSNKDGWTTGVYVLKPTYAASPITGISVTGAAVDNTKKDTAKGIDGVITLSDKDTAPDATDNTKVSGTNTAFQKISIGIEPYNTAATVTVGREDKGLFAMNKYKEAAGTNIDQTNANGTALDPALQASYTTLATLGAAVGPVADSTVVLTASTPKADKSRTDFLQLTKLEGQAGSTTLTFSYGDNKKKVYLVNVDGAEYGATAISGTDPVVAYYESGEKLVSTSVMIGTSEYFFDADGHNIMLNAGNTALITAEGTVATVTEGDKLTKLMVLRDGNSGNGVRSSDGLKQISETVWYYVKQTDASDASTKGTIVISDFVTDDKTNKTYYAGEDGILLRSDKTTVDGKTYWFDENCALLLGEEGGKLVTTAGGEVYLDETGAVMANTAITKDGSVIAITDENGAVKVPAIAPGDTYALVTVNEKSYLVDATGKVLTKAAFEALGVDSVKVGDVEYVVDNGDVAAVADVRYNAAVNWKDQLPKTFSKGSTLPEITYTIKYTSLKSGTSKETGTMKAEVRADKDYDKDSTATEITITATPNLTGFWKDDKGTIPATAEPLSRTYKFKNGSETGGSSQPAESESGDDPTKIEGEQKVIDKEYKAVQVNTPNFANKNDYAVIYFVGQTTNADPDSVTFSDGKTENSYWTIDTDVDDKALVANGYGTIALKLKDGVDPATALKSGKKLELKVNCIGASSDSTPANVKLTLKGSNKLPSLAMNLSTVTGFGMDDENEATFYLTEKKGQLTGSSSDWTVMFVDKKTDTTASTTQKVEAEMDSTDGVVKVTAKDAGKGFLCFHNSNWANEKAYVYAALNVKAGNDNAKALDLTAKTLTLNNNSTVDAAKEEVITTVIAKGGQDLGSTTITLAPKKATNGGSVDDSGDYLSPDGKTKVSVSGTEITVTTEKDAATGSYQVLVKADGYKDATLAVKVVNTKADKNKALKLTIKGKMDAVDPNSVIFLQPKLNGYAGAVETAVVTDENSKYEVDGIADGFIVLKKSDKYTYAKTAEEVNLKATLTTGQELTASVKFAPTVGKFSASSENRTITKAEYDTTDYAGKSAPVMAVYTYNFYTGPTTYEQRVYTYDLTDSAQTEITLTPGTSKQITTTAGKDSEAGVVKFVPTSDGKSAAEKAGKAKTSSVKVTVENKTLGKKANVTIKVTLDPTKTAE